MRDRALAQRAIYWSCRGIAWVKRAAGGAERTVEGFARTALSLEELQTLTAEVYDDQPYRPIKLFAWEEPWWKAALPPPPASILVGGCGRGREVRALLDLGYEVWAFDPSMDSIAQCQRENPRAVYVGCFSYEDLLQGATRSSRTQLLPPGITFGAVLMGWGSLSHVIDETAQCNVLQALAALTPNGPILASFLSRSLTASEGRAERLGATLGTRVARWRGRPESQLDRMHVRLLPHGGLVYLFSEPRLHALAQACGRRVELHMSSGYPHATFWPGASAVT